MFSFFVEGLERERVNLTFGKHMILIVLHFINNYYATSTDEINLTLLFIFTVSVNITQRLGFKGRVLKQKQSKFKLKLK